MAPARRTAPSARWRGQQSARARRRTHGLRPAPAACAPAPGAPPARRPRRARARRARRRDGAAPRGSRRPRGAPRRACPARPPARGSPTACQVTRTVFSSSGGFGVGGICCRVIRHADGRWQVWHVHDPPQGMVTGPSPAACARAHAPSGWQTACQARMELRARACAERGVPSSAGARHDCRRTGGRRRSTRCARRRAARHRRGRPAHLSAAALGGSAASARARSSTATKSSTATCARGLRAASSAPASAPSSASAPTPPGSAASACAAPRRSASCAARARRQRLGALSASFALAKLAGTAVYHDHALQPDPESR